MFLKGDNFLMKYHLVFQREVPLIIWHLLIIFGYASFCAHLLYK